jgi:predicted DNA binding CopG/RHH family protein
MIMSSDKLNKEEQDLITSYDAGEWHPVSEVQSEKERYREAARATFRKDKRVNIRISSKDLTGLQKRAIMEGIPYQTLIASVLHKYISGTLVDKTSKND